MNRSLSKVKHLRIGSHNLTTKCSPIRLRESKQGLDGQSYSVSLESLSRDDKFHLNNAIQAQEFGFMWK